MPGIWTFLHRLSTVLVIAVAAVVLWSHLYRSARIQVRGPAIAAPAVPNEAQNLNGAAVQGSAEARVGLLVYSDFTCPYSRRFAQVTKKALQEKYVESGRVLLAFRRFPLRPEPSLAFTAAKSSVCAQAQGRFWSMHDGLFGEAGSLQQATVATLPNTLGLNVDAYESCLRGESSRLVNEDLESGRALGIRSTPVFFLGKLLRVGEGAERLLYVHRVLHGARPLREFEDALDGLLTEPE